jgi:stage IV sporulation protein FB
MIQIPGKIPISIHPAFWLMAAIIGYLNTLSFLGTLIWIGVIFISVLVHEFGHALTAYAFGQHPRIELVALGGLTYHNGNRLAVWKQFFIVFNGPLFGFILFGVAYAVSYFAQQKEGVLASILLLFQVINLFWTVVNLVPVLPLDGGQLLRIVLEGFFGVKGFRYALLASAVVSVAASLFFFLYQAFLVGALFFLFAFQSYDTWRKMRFLSEEDKSEDLKASLEAAEQQLQKGSKDQALEAFQRIHRRSVHGVIHNLAAQYIAFLEYEKRNVRKAYEVLFPIRHELASDALCLLHRLAFEEKNYRLVVELSGNCFQTLPTVETALRNAYAHAQLQQVEPSIGWLQTALEEGLENLKEVLAEPSLDPIRKQPEFIQWVKSHS